MSLPASPVRTARGDPFVVVLAALALAAGGAAIVHGLAQMEASTAIHWTAGGAARALALAGGAAVVLYALSERFDGRVIPWTLSGVALLLTAAGALVPLATLGLLALACALVGARLRALWNDDVALTDDLVASMLLGAGAYATLTSVLAHWPVNTVGLYTLLVAVPVLVDWRRALDLVRHCARQVRVPQHQAASIPAIAASCLLLVYAVVALLPELGWDALVLHLHIPAATLARREWHYDVTRHAFAVAPALGDWLYTIAYAMGGESAARLLNVGFVVILAQQTARLAQHAGARPPWDWLAAALLLSTPVVFTIGSSLFIDAVWAAFLLGGITLLLGSPTLRERPARAVTACVLIGFSAATKSVTLPLLPLLLVVVLSKTGSLRQSAVRAALLVAAVAGALAAIKPYATAWLLTGNPVFPFFNEIFGSPHFPLEDAKIGERYRHGVGWDDLYGITFESSRHIEGRSGAAGFQWLLLLPAAAGILVAKRFVPGLWLLGIGVAMLAITFHFQSYLRYVIPSIAVLAAAIAAAGSAIAAVAPLVRGMAIAAIVACIALNVVFLNAAAAYEDFPLSAALGNPAARDALLAESAPHRIAAGVAATLAQRNGRLAFFSQPAFADAPMDAVHTSLYSPGFFKAYNGAATANDLARVLGEWNVRYVVFDPQWRTAVERSRAIEATTPVAEIGRVQLRKPRTDLVFTRELLQSAELATPQGWVLTNNARHDPRSASLAVSAESPAYQPVPVTGGEAYLLTVVARCDDLSTQGRLQVIWLAADGAVAHTLAEAFPCTPQPQAHAREIVAPANAKTAVVYATGNTAAAITVDSVSFRSKAR